MSVGGSAIRQAFQAALQHELNSLYQLMAQLDALAGHPLPAGDTMILTSTCIFASLTAFFLDLSIQDYRWQTQCPSDHKQILGWQGLQSLETGAPELMNHLSEGLERI